MKLGEEFIHEIVNDNKRYIMKYLMIILGIIIHRFFLTDLIKVNRVKTEEIVHQVNDALIDLKNGFNKKEIPKNDWYS